MSSFSQLISSNTSLNYEEISLLKGVLGEWSTYADIAPADLTLWVFTDRLSANPGGILCVAQCRPDTGVTNYPEDLVGLYLGSVQANQVYGYLQDFKQGKLDEERYLTLRGKKSEILPIFSSNHVCGLILRTPSRDLDSSGIIKQTREMATKAIGKIIKSSELVDLIANKTDYTKPRYSDGFIALDQYLKIIALTPNAVSVLNRLNWRSTYVGVDLINIVTALNQDRQLTESNIQLIEHALKKKKPVFFEVENYSRTILFYFFPIADFSSKLGGIILVKDISDLKEHERVLLSKDTAIREIHHRVKNNLQGVSSLLRLQARRAKTSEASLALQEAESRIRVIGLVHDELAKSTNELVDLDILIKKLINMVKSIQPNAQGKEVILKGNFGKFYSSNVASIAQVILELLSNSYKHAFKGRDSGKIIITATRTSRYLHIDLRDDGVGNVDTDELFAKDSKSLGMKIVNELVQNNLGGEISLIPTRVGTHLNLSIPLDGDRKTISSEGS